MEKQLSVATAPKDSTFQVRINSEIKKTVEEIYAGTGLTLTDAFNAFIQQSINVQGLPFLVTQNGKEALREQAVAVLLMNMENTDISIEVQNKEKKESTSIYEMKEKEVKIITREE